VERRRALHWLDGRGPELKRQTSSGPCRRTALAGGPGPDGGAHLDPSPGHAHDRAPPCCGRLAGHPVKRTPQLNERSYGDLEGRTKSEVRAECGDELFDLWRRSYRVAPPAASDGRRGESLEDVFRRVVPYWRTAVRADLDAGERVLLVGHGSSLRALVKELDSVSDAAITGINIPTGMPLVYELDHDLRPVTPAGRYLEPVAAMQAASAVANEGREEVP
jgi:broad specificity phosphatase PhoE